MNAATGQHTRITVVVDNLPGNDNLPGEHGLSLWVEHKGSCGFFDTGQTGLVIENARTMNLPIEAAEWVALSHGHYDHGGGMAELARLLHKPQIYCHPAAFDQKYIQEESGQMRYAGMPVDASLLQNTGARITWTSRFMQVGDGMAISGTIPKPNGVKLNGPTLMVHKEGNILPDPMEDEQALVLETRNGLAVLVGCTHTRIENTLQHVASITGEKRIHAVIGGIHLDGAPRREVFAAAEALYRYRVQRIGLAHCTGKTAAEILAKELPNRTFCCETGMVIDLD